MIPSRPSRTVAAGALVAGLCVAAPAMARQVPAKAKAEAAVAKRGVPAAPALRLPAAAAGLHRAADRALRSGDLDDAARLYVRAALAAPDEPLLRMTAGVALATVRQVPEAAGQFRRAAAMADDDLIAVLQYQGALAEMGEASEAQSVYLEAVRRFSRAGRPGLDASGSIGRIRAARTSLPDSPILYLLLADAYQMQEQWAEADKAYRRAISLAPAWSKPLVNHGLSYLNQGKPAEAILVFQAALKRDPNNRQLRLFQAEAQREAGRYGDAINNYRPLTREKTAALRAQAIVGLGQSLASAGKYDEAIKSLNRAPDDPAAQAALGEVQTKAGNFGAAARAYDRALRLGKAEGLFGTQPVLYRALSEAQLAAGTPDAALRTLERAFGDEPDSAALWHRLSGQAHLALNDPARAETAFKAALDADDSLYPYETLQIVSDRGLLTPLTQSYLADLGALENGGLRIDTRAPGAAAAGARSDPATPAVGSALSTAPSVHIGPAAPAALTRDGQANAHRSLANLARYRGDYAEEVRQREAVTRLRSRALDFYLLGEAGDRAGLPARAFPAFQRALNLGGLSPALAARARERVRALEPVVKPHSGTPPPLYKGPQGDRGAGGTGKPGEEG